MRRFMFLSLAAVLLATPCAADTWEHVKPEALNFEAEFPGKPEFTEQTGDDGGKIRTYVVKSPVAAYDLTIWDFEPGAIGPGDVDQVLENIRNRSIGSMRGELRTETKIELGGLPARDTVADVMGMVWRGRTVIAGNRIYQIVAIVSKGTETSESTERYMSSFKLLGDAAAPPKK